REVTVFEEVALPCYNRLGNALDGEESLLEIADQPARFLQMLGEQCGLAVAGLAEVIRILLIDANAWIDRRIDADNPALLLLANDDIRHDGPRLERADLRPGTGIETANQLHCDAQTRLGAAECLQQPCVVTRCQQTQLGVHDLESQLATGCVLLE